MVRTRPCDHLRQVFLGGLPRWSQPTTAATKKRSHPSKSVTPTFGPCTTVKGSPEKASCSERNLHEPSTQTGGAFPASYGDNTSPDNDMTLDGVKDVNGLRVYESEQWVVAD